MLRINDNQELVADQNGEEEVIECVGDSCEVFPGTRLVFVVSDDCIALPMCYTCFMVECLGLDATEAVEILEDSI